MAETKTPKAAGKARRKPAKTKTAKTRNTKAKTARSKTSKAKAAPARKAVAGKAAVSPRRKPRAAARTKAAPKRATRPASSGFDIARMLDHPLVADLLAVGAIAAVAAIADHSVKTRTGEAESGSSKAVKAAGKAAATAIGKRLMTEVDAIRDVSKAKDR